jgi:hypothetical protein
MCNQNDNDKIINCFDDINLLSKEITLIIYGKTNKDLNKIKFYNVNNACYSLFNLRETEIYQDNRDFWGRSSTFPGKGNFLFCDKLPNADKGDQHKYYFCNISTYKKEYEAAENKISNQIEKEFGVINDSADGEPLFTCYKD